MGGAMGTGIKVVAVALVRNEADILPAWLAHLATWADDVILMDHGSDDGSHALMQEAADKHGWTVWNVAVPGYHQEAFTTFAVHHAFAFGADWVVPIDADEFVDDALRATLKKTEGAGLLQWRACVPDDEWGHWWRAPIAGPQKKVAIPRSLWQSGRKLRLGNHVLLDDAGKEVAASVVGEMHHFPLRSLEQMRRKIVLGSISLMARGDEYGEKNPWRVVLKLLSNGISDADLISFASRYPTLRGPDMRCVTHLRGNGWRRFSGPALTPMQPLDPWKAVASRLSSFEVRPCRALELHGVTLREVA